jgi:hypothetical protein
VSQAQRSAVTIGALVRPWSSGQSGAIMAAFRRGAPDSARISGGAHPASMPVVVSREERLHAPCWKYRGWRLQFGLLDGDKTKVRDCIAERNDTFPEGLLDVFFASGSAALDSHFFFAIKTKRNGFAWSFGRGRFQHLGPGPSTTTSPANLTTSTLVNRVGDHSLAAIGRRLVAL